jgi:hypothetical protein
MLVSPSMGKLVIRKIILLQLRQVYPRREWKSDLKKDDITHR